MTRPGVSDGRAFGLDPYRPVGAIDAKVLHDNRITDATAYRRFIKEHGAQLVDTFRRAAYGSQELVDFGCTRVPVRHG